MRENMLLLLHKASLDNIKLFAKDDAYLGKFSISCV